MDHDQVVQCFYNRHDLVQKYTPKEHLRITERMILRKNHKKWNKKRRDTGKRDQTRWRHAEHTSKDICKTPFINESCGL
jgi:hypothetical protein